MKSIFFKKGDITLKVRKPESSFLYAICCLALFYISTKYRLIIQWIFKLQSGQEVYADADANANGIHPKNNLSPQPVVGEDINTMHIPENLILRSVIWFLPS